MSKPLSFNKEKNSFLSSVINHLCFYIIYHLQSGVTVSLIKKVTAEFTRNEFMAIFLLRTFLYKFLYKIVDCARYLVQGRVHE